MSNFESILKIEESKKKQNLKNAGFSISNFKKMALTQWQTDYAQYLSRTIRGETTWADIVVYGRDHMNWTFQPIHDGGYYSDVEEDCPGEPWDPGHLLPENEEW
tara:strand:- start:1320 stop:1631 length:312 start_codon:yes stop_codon:yes gene_type:complete